MEPSLQTNSVMYKTSAAGFNTNRSNFISRKASTEENVEEFSKLSVFKKPLNNTSITVVPLRNQYYHFKPRIIQEDRSDYYMEKMSMTGGPGVFKNTISKKEDN
jgi:hypothetical protein